MRRRSRSARPTLAERDCGDCRACCVTLGFEAGPDESAFTKVAGEPCRHLVQIGCAVYDDRPPVCRRFECGWLGAPNLPDELRPDRCGVLFCTNDNPLAADLPGAEAYAVFAYELRPGALDEEWPQWLVEQLAGEITLILVRPGEAPEVLTADSALQAHLEADSRQQ